MANQRPNIDPSIAEFYERTPEENRLERGASLLEGLRTRELIQRFAPAPPATVVDVGGGAGVYGLWLSGAGYDVHLVDATSRLVEEARRRSAKQTRPLATAEVGDARALQTASASADVVLLLGPMYHLTEREDRVRALSEAARVLKPGGRLFAAAISRWASALDGVARDLFADQRFAAIVERDLRDGQHRNPTDRLDYFTTAYFHRPEELRAEAIEAGLEVDGVFGIEGPGWLFADIEARMEDPRLREDVLRVARQLEAEPAVLGMSAHFLLVASKPQTAIR